MSKFNRTRIPRVRGTGPIVSDPTPTGATFEGAPGYARDTKSELFLLAVTNMVGEDTFYEKAGTRDTRFQTLVAQVAVEDPEWMGRFLPWLRNSANMRSASLVGALEAARAMVKAGIVGSRAIVSGVLQRADEPGEALAYWTSRYGRAIPKPIKRGVADAAVRLYNERSLLKYDTDSKGFRFGDVLELTHAAPDKVWQPELFKYALDRRHNRDTLPERLEVIRLNAVLRADPQPDALLSPSMLYQAGFTWEDALSLAGKSVPKAQLWEALIPSMGYMALLRNLRNFDDAGISEEAAALVKTRLTDPEQVARSRQLPFRFLSAFKATESVRWHSALERALTLSLANIPELSGRTLVLVDRSGSMWAPLSRNSKLHRAEAAALFGSALALRNAGRVDLVEFGTHSATVSYRKGGSVLSLVQKFGNLGGTNTAQALRGHFANHDRVIVVTDEQAHPSWGGLTVNTAIPADVPMYTWNLAGYRFGHSPESPNRWTFGGLTDRGFEMIPLLEAGKNGNWPF